jgi:hypothetical protein
MFEIEQQLNDYMEKMDLLDDYFEQEHLNLN